MDNHRVAIRNVIVFIVGGVLGCIIGYISFRNEPKTVEKVVTKETIVHDTLTQIKPVYVENRVVDSIEVKVMVHDTVEVPIYLPREEKVYEDSSYRAVVSGYKPSLDKIEVYQQTRYIDRTEYIQPKRWGFSIQLGTGLIYDIPKNRLGYGLYGGIGFHWKF